MQPLVKEAFAESLQTFWHVLIGVAAIGFVASWFMRGLPLHTSMDRKFALQNGSEEDNGGKTERKDLESGEQ